jgi:hypothetical protein
VGIPGVRLGKDARGRKYQSLNVPGTGIYRRDYSAAKENIPTQQTETPWFAAPRTYFLGAAFLVVLWVVLRVSS